MIPNNIRFENLNPSLWRNLGLLTQCFFKERATLWVLMKDKIPLRAVLEGNPVTVPGLIDVEALFEKYPHVKCIILAEEESLIRYYVDVNQKIEVPISADEYFSYIVKRLARDKGITYYLKDGETLPPPPWIDFYGICRRMVHDFLPRTCHLLLEILDGNKVFFQMAVTIRENEILRVSTMDDYCFLLGLETVEEPLSSVQLEQIKAATEEEVLSYRVEKDKAIAFLENKVKAYMEHW